MKLIIILMCLGLERYLEIGRLLRRFSWFESYLTLLEKSVKTPALWSAWAGLALVLLPLVLSFSFVYWVTCSWIFGLVGLMLNVFVLLYCLGPDDLYHQLQEYFRAVDGSEKAAAKDIQKAIIRGPVPRETAKAHRALTLSIFKQANERLFAVLFWFIVLGPVGALIYRSLLLLQFKAVESNSRIKTLASSTSLLVSLLDWVPARLTSICYTVMGNFQKSFSHWLSLAPKGLGSSQALLTQTGLLAMGIQPDDVACATVEENREAMDIIDRILVFILFIIALLTLVAWIA